jgi:hypothetical protein
MKIRPHFAILVSAVALCAAGSAVAKGTLYDDFNASKLDPAKWVGFGGDPYWLDLSRAPGANGMEFYGVGYAPTTNNSSAYGGAWGIAVTSPNSVTGVSYDFTVNNIATIACKNSNLPAATSTDFEGSFFNDQSGSSLQGDVELSVAAVQHNTDGSGAPLSVIADAWECADNNCSQNQLFNQVIGTVERGAKNTLSISWDKSHHRFAFVLNGAKTNLSYSVPDSAPAYYPYKGFDIQRYVPDCTGKKRPYTLIDATLGPVYINP